MQADEPRAAKAAPPTTVSCAPDIALSDAAAELLLTGKAPDSQQLMAAVRAAGSEAVAPRALYLPADDPAHVAKWLTDMRAKNDVDLICGDARSERARLIVASARAATLVVERAHLRGTLAAGFERPELILRRRDGTLTRVAVEREALERGIPIDPEWQATQVQLLAWGPSGPRPVAERALTREGEPDAVEHLSLSSETPLDANGIADVLAQLRARHGRPTLRRNRLANGVAQAHAKAVCAQGRVVHELEPGVDPETRIARAGLKAQLTGETVARAADANAAMEATWQSPSHSLTLLERRFTDVGIGLATDDQHRTCLVVLLMAWPRPVPRASARAAEP
ncbi:MAG TPA: CAP domain-containing protein [Polyangiales bacterium]|nr:CAP domain-containing protein [Polyangiales bacterium]